MSESVRRMVTVKKADLEWLKRHPSFRLSGILAEALATLKENERRNKNVIVEEVINDTDPDNDLKETVSAK